MEINIINFESNDGLVLHGLYYDFHKNKSIIHVHGLAGNFYSSAYHHQLAETYSELGFNYLSFNNRGSEYIKQLKNNQTGKSSLYGYSYEIFSESDYDILGAIDFLSSIGNQSYAIQGHSSGCQKIIYTITKHNLKPQFVVLLSPCDDVGLAINEYGQPGLNEKIHFAINYTQLLLPDNFFFNLPISKATFLSHFGPNNYFDIFHYYQPSSPFSELLQNKSETLVIFGEKDHLKDVEKVKQVYKNMKNYSIEIIPGADHKYKEKELELSLIIKDYVRQHTPSE